MAYPEVPEEGALAGADDALDVDREGLPPALEVAQVGELEVLPLPLHLLQGQELPGERASSITVQDNWQGFD